MNYCEICGYSDHDAIDCCNENAAQLNRLRQTIIDREKRVNKMVMKNKKTAKYYVGSSNLVNPVDMDYLKYTVEDAIKEAKRRVESTGIAHPVVQILYIIEPAAAPVRVRKVK